ncbi:hypothetical protein VPNG_08160 [Cytospora leucostoma]|uniref:ASST-domain-containing protein n=1 Tax=Cytospora leucostoma TaxID=1230097 RepID=A0A423WIA7_9PEZI|nr:hypothetical protein VPNG_08160 [Cytospora leucostoma]
MATRNSSKEKKLRERIDSLRNGIPCAHFKKNPTWSEHGYKEIRGSLPPDEDGFVTVHSFGELVLQIKLPGGIRGPIFFIGTQDVANVLTFVLETLFEMDAHEEKRRDPSDSGVTGTGKEYIVLEPPYYGRLYHKGFIHWENRWHPDSKTTLGIIPTRRGPPPRPQSIEDTTGDVLHWRIREIPISLALRPALDNAEQHHDHQDADHHQSSLDRQTYSSTTRANVYPASKTDTTSSEVSRRPSAMPSPETSRALGHDLTHHDYDNSPYANSYGRAEEVYDRPLASLSPAYDQTTPREGEAYPGHVHSEEYSRWYGGRRDEYISTRGYEEDYDSSSSEEIIRDYPVNVPRGQHGNINIPGRHMHGRGAVNVPRGNVGGGMGLDPADFTKIRAQAFDFLYNDESALGYKYIPVQGETIFGNERGTYEKVNSTCIKWRLSKNLRVHNRLTDYEYDAQLHTGWPATSRLLENPECSTEKNEASPATARPHTYSLDDQPDINFVGYHQQETSYERGSYDSQRSINQANHPVPGTPSRQSTAHVDDGVSELSMGQSYSKSPDADAVSALSDDYSLSKFPDYVEPSSPTPPNQVYGALQREDEVPLSANETNVASTSTGDHHGGSTGWTFTDRDLIGWYGPGAMDYDTNDYPEVRDEYDTRSYVRSYPFAPRAHGDFISTDYDGYNHGKLGQRPRVHFRSSEDFTAVLQVNVWNESAISSKGSHIFLRHDGAIGDDTTSSLSSPLILDSRDLSTVYVNRTFNHVFGTRVQENHGRKYLTFWEGDKRDGIGSGYGLVYDDTYRQVYNVSAKNIAANADLHEFTLTGDGTALVTGVERFMAPTRDWKGWHGEPEWRILNAIFQEVDLETNEVLFSWSAIEHIDPMDSYERMSKDWDAYHLNSVQKTRSGNYLISIRHTSSVHLIDGKTGYIIWTLGGRHNDFVELTPADGIDPDSYAPLLSFAWQHHARFVPGTNETELTLFDNHAKLTSHGKCTSDCSPPTAKLLHEYQHPSRLQAQSQGSMQVLEGGNVFIGWGRCPSFTEHLPSGEAVMDVQFSPWHAPEAPDALDNYRAYKLDWAATPWWGPELALRNTSGGDLAVYASWNGATETRLTVGREYMAGLRRVWAEALDINGVVLRSTEVLDLSGGEAMVSLEMDENRGGDLVDRPVVDSAGMSAGAWAWLILGLVSIVLVAVAGAFIWRRRRDYDRLENIDLDSDAGSDVSTVHGFGDFSIDYGPEAYEDYNTAPASAITED